eukprot:TRINITY_DN9711_c0_g1_i1.p1 TRINITY_DN9711_c0_g1~~TRINITY_DN9711_c0_g1_i1.p1  ORF type:complete len:433 (+),score=123.16 TRINITY_DN9711_c0_g1_i1:107-1300(+)
MSLFQYGPKDELVSRNEREFIEESLREGLRVDGRAVFDYRALRITFGKEHGQVQIQLGRTRIYVVTTCKVIEPLPDRGTEGFFTFAVDFSPIASPKFEAGRKTAEGIELGRIIERGLRESRAIDTEALCIVAGEKVWSIRLDVHVMDDNGNLVDACSIAAITALYHFRRPDITIGETVTVHSITEKPPVPLSIHHMPLCVTFAIFQDGDVAIVDPNWKEERVMEGRITLILNIHKELCGVQKAGGVPLSPEAILKMAKIAMVKVKELTHILQVALKEDEQKRKEERKERGSTGGTTKSAIADDSLMVAGIGAQAGFENDTMMFYDGNASVAVQEDTIARYLPPSMPSERFKEFEEFADTLKKSAKGTSGGLGESDDSDESDEEEEEEGADMLVDEFA